MAHYNLFCQKKKRQAFLYLTSLTEILITLKHFKVLTHCKFIHLESPKHEISFYHKGEKLSSRSIALESPKNEISNRSAALGSGLWLGWSSSLSYSVSVVSFGLTSKPRELPSHGGINNMDYMMKNLKLSFQMYYLCRGMVMNK